MRWPISETSYLRPLERADAGELHALIEANRSSLARWLPWAAGQTREDTAGFIRRAKEQYDGRCLDCVVHAILSAERGRA